MLGGGLTPSLSRSITCHSPLLAGGGRLLPEELTQHEQQVRRSLGDAAREIGIPVGAERDVNACAIALVHQGDLRAPPHAIEHLELPALARNAHAQGKSL